MATLTCESRPDDTYEALSALAGRRNSSIAIEAVRLPGAPCRPIEPVSALSLDEIARAAPPSGARRRPPRI